jgi:cytochrome c
LIRHLTLSAGIALAALGVALSGQAIGAPSAPSGETLFRQRCSMCHSAVSSRQMPLGPNLAGVVGRKAASTSFAYSPALKQSGLTWNRANLDRYLTSPPRLVPGTKMVVVVPNPAERGALIDYLAASH